MYITAYSVLEDSAMAHGHNVHGALSGLIGATDNLREAIGSPMAQPAPVAKDAIALLSEVAHYFTGDDDLPNDLLPRIDALLRARAAQPEGGA